MNLRFTKNEIIDAAKALWLYGKPRRIWAFHAPMGAGKTTFINALCKDVLEVKDAVSSPTFAIINEYESPVAGTIYHMDWYRLKGEEEAVQAGVGDALLSGCFCLIEWPDIAPVLLPGDTLHIYLNLVNESTRQLTVN